MRRLDGFTGHRRISFGCDNDPNLVTDYATELSDSSSRIGVCWVSLRNNLSSVQGIQGWYPGLLGNPAVCFGVSSHVRRLLHLLREGFGMICLSAPRRKACKRRPDAALCLLSAAVATAQSSSPPPRPPRVTLRLPPASTTSPAAPAAPPQFEAADIRRAGQHFHLHAS